MALAIEERALLQESLERVAREHYTLAARRALLAGDVSFNPTNWQRLAELGILALPFETSLGGLDGSLADVMVIGRILGQGLSLDPYIPCVLLAGRLLARAHNPILRDDWLQHLMSGSKLIALAHHEPRANAASSSTRLQHKGHSLYLNGTKRLVPLAPELDAFVVTARNPRGVLQVCLVPADTPGITIRSCRLVDGTLAGGVEFHDVTIPEHFALDLTDTESALEEVFTYARAVVATDSVACMSAVLRLAIDHCNTRKQFGQPIGRFQVLKHRLVDAHLSLEQAEALLELVSLQTSHWPTNVAAAKAFIDEHALRLGHAAIQMHGAMGLTDELAVSHYHKRMVANSLLYGNPAECLDEFASSSEFLTPGSPSSALAFPELLAPPEEEFRQQVRSFLATDLTPSLKTTARRLTCTFPEKDTIVEWQQHLRARGWLAPLLPKELGGTGWSAVERFLFEYECAVGGAPERAPMGFRYVGPVVARFGSEWQKEYFLPRLFSGEHYWAQGFSEPGAGSDLAALKTTALLDGDDYVVNGTKIWTTHAHYADWIFCLVRTSQGARPQDGISFLLIDLKSPGIRIEPIPLLTVDHEVNQVFFDDVRVPARNLVGEPGKGWHYAKYLLELERGGSVMSGRARHELDAVKELASLQPPEQPNQPYPGADPSLVRALAALEIRLMALEWLELRRARSVKSATDPGVAGSVIKLLSSELQEEITEWGMRIAGLDGLELTGRPIPDPPAGSHPATDLRQVAMPRYLNTRAFTIFAGTSEIQREIIARHIMGMSP
jgi:alkylation response protein AidB-like acyl-CoA dehydrogenase